MSLPHLCKYHPVSLPV